MKTHLHCLLVSSIRLHFPLSFTNVSLIDAHINVNDNKVIEKWVLVTCKTVLTVADLEGVRVVRLNPQLEANYFNFMGKCMKNQVKC